MGVDVECGPVEVGPEAQVGEHLAELPWRRVELQLELLRRQVSPPVPELQQEQQEEEKPEQGRSRGPESEAEPAGE